LLGSFSKVVAPGLRLGWICGPKDIIKELVTAKQAADLHTGTVVQRILSQYLHDNDLDSHVAMLRKAYGHRRDAMISAMEQFFPSEVTFTRPQGGMFLWVSLPGGLSSLRLFEVAIGQKVAFVPGTPFYVDGGGESNLRLNFSNASESEIETGIARLGAAMREMME
jgi:2-aminoadipate transaminase